jgi:hypothetical protein
MYHYVTLLQTLKLRAISILSITVLLDQGLGIVQLGSLLRASGCGLLFRMSFHLES